MSEPREPIEIGGTSVAPGTREDVEIHVERLASGPWISIPAVVLHGRREGPVGLDLGGGPRRRDQRRRGRPAAARDDPARGAGRDPDPRPGRQPARLHGGRALPARPPRPQPLLPGLDPRLARRPARAPVHGRDHQPLRARHRPALRLRRPRQPAADPGRPRRPRDPRGGARLRGPAQPPLTYPRRLAARGRDPGGDDDAAVRGRRGQPLRRLRDRVRLSTASSGCCTGSGWSMPRPAARCGRP